MLYWGVLFHLNWSYWDVSGNSGLVDHGALPIPWPQFPIYNLRVKLSGTHKDFVPGTLFLNAKNTDCNISWKKKSSLSRFVVGKHEYLSVEFSNIASYFMIFPPIVIFITSKCFPSQAPTVNMGIY